MYTLKRIENIFLFNINTNRDLWYLHRNFFSNLSPNVKLDTEYYHDEMPNKEDERNSKLIQKVLIPLGILIFVFICSSCLYISMSNSQAKRMQLLSTISHKQLENAESSSAQFIQSMVITRIYIIYIRKLLYNLMNLKCEWLIMRKNQPKI